MFRVVFLQGLIVIIVSAVAGVLIGVIGGLSAAAGGAAYAIPNFLFALRLKSVGIRPHASYPMNFFFGEFAKIVLTFVLLIVTVWIYADLHWPSMLIGLVLASQAMFLAFWEKN